MELLYNATRYNKTRQIQDAFRKLRRWIWATKSSSRTSIRHRRKNTKLFRACSGLHYKRIDRNATDFEETEQPGLDANISQASQVKQVFEEGNGDEISDFEDLLRFCNEKRCVTLADVMPFWKLTTASQYGERMTDFLYFDADGSPKIFVCLPVRAKDLQSPSTSSESIGSVIPEVVSSLYLRNLIEGPTFIAPNFPFVYSVHYVEDNLPTSGGIHSTEDPPQKEAYVAIQRNFCGIPLVEKVCDPLMCVSIVAQITAALSVAEEAYEFEHRSLHVGNILINDAKGSLLIYSTGKLTFAVETRGIHAFIFEFTRCRINTGRETFFTDFENFTEREAKDGKNIGDFDSWLDQKAVSSFIKVNNQGNMWNFNPKTNIKWLKHLIENCLHILRNDLPNVEQENHYPDEQGEAMLLLESWSEFVLSHDSAFMFLQNAIIDACPLVFSLAIC